MPIIASQTIKVDVNEDRTIQVILLEELSRSRCIKLSDVPVNDKEKMYDVVRQLVGSKVITCDKDSCCVSKNYFDFVKRMDGFKQ